MEENNNIAFPQSLLDEVKRITDMFPEGKQKSALLRVLHLAQSHWGYLSVDIMDYVARLLHLQPIEVYEVATFYSMYDTEKVGKVKFTDFDWEFCDMAVVREIFTLVYSGKDLE